MAQLRQRLTLFDMTMIAIGGTIGSGIFLTPSLIAHSLPSPALILAVWLAGGLMAMAGALTFSELAALMPRAGGRTSISPKRTAGWWASCSAGRTSSSATPAASAR